MKKPVIITIIFVIILSLIGGGVFWYLNKYQVFGIKYQEENNGQEVNPPVTENENQPIENLQGEVVDSSAADVDTSNWLTYRNEEYGFEFEYLSNLNIEERGNDFPNKLSLSFFPKDKERYTEASANLGTLLYVSDKAPNYEHVTDYKNYDEFKKFIINLGNLKEHEVLNSNDINWFCFVPAKTKAPINIEMKECYAEKGDKNFYQIMFYFSPNTKDYFSMNDMDRLVKKF